MLNPNIILGVQQPNLVNSLAQGQAMRVREDAMQNQNALRNLYQTQGANILSGDQNAINALAAIDPGQALDVQAHHRRQAALSAEEERAVREHTLKLDAAARDEFLQRMEMGLRAASSATNPQEWDALAQQFNAPELVGEFANRDAHLRRYMSIAEIMNAEAPEASTEPAAMQTLRARAEAAGLREGTAEYQNFMLTGGKEAPSRVVRGADGNIVYAEGAAAIDPPKLTVDAGKNTGFLIRLEDSQEILNNLEAEGLSFFQQNAENIPLGLGNYLVGENFQKFDQARRDFVNAILRRESGAVISDQEFDNAEKQYFPIPGDSEAVIAQKRQNRQNAIEGVRAGSGDGATYVEQLQRQSEPTEAGGSGSGAEFQFQNDQQRLLFEKYSVPTGG